MSIEDKLNKIIATSKNILETNKECLGVLKELLEKLTKEEVTFSQQTSFDNSPLTGKSEESSNVDINKHLYELANEVERRKVTDKSETNYSLDIYLGLMDDKGNVISKQPLYKQEEGSIVCEPLRVKKKVYKVRVFDAAKVFVGWLDEDGVVELIKAKHSISDVDKPFTYYQNWYINHEDSLSNYTFFTPKNPILEIPSKDINYKQYPCKILENCVTGYLTEDGRAIYYDQYL